MNYETLEENKTEHRVIGHIFYPDKQYNIELCATVKGDYRKKHTFNNALDEMSRCCSATNRMPSIGDVYITDKDNAEYTITKVYPSMSGFMVLLELTEIL